MKSKIIEAPKPEPEPAKYPCLRQYADGLVVLFCARRAGFVVVPVNLWDIGAYSEDWTEEDTKPFNGKVELSNE